MEINLNEDRNIAEGIAKAVSPYEKGNLRYNAIRSELVDNGFNIIYDLQRAFYIYFLEEGTRFTHRHAGFIEFGTVPRIADFLNAKYNGDKDRLHKLKMLARQGYKDIPTMKGQEPELFARGQRLQASLNVNPETLAKQYNWNYRNE
jgi:hypothetical protein